MSPMERMTAILDGRPVDRPPYAFWHHFNTGSTDIEAVADAHLSHLERFGLDFLKVMNDFGSPWKADIRSARDLRRLQPIDGTEGPFGLQLALIQNLSSLLSKRVLITTTVFNAWSVLRRIVVPSTDGVRKPPGLGGGRDSIDRRLTDLLVEDRSSFVAALQIIEQGLAVFATQCLAAGADGIFLSVRDDVLPVDEYEALLRQGDLAILHAVSGARLNILHICGAPKGFHAFAAYPVSVINWADRTCGPAIRDVSNWLKPVVCGGVDNLRTLPGGRPADVMSEVDDSIRQSGDRQMIIAPGCTYDATLVPEANLDAIATAATRRAHAGD